MSHFLQQIGLPMNGDGRNDHLLSARSTHLGNTLSIDMGNSFDFTSRPFYGRVMETTLHCGATAAVRKTGIEGPRKHVAIVSAFWDEPQERLQMEGSIRAGGSLRPARPCLSPAPVAAANLPAMAEPDSSLAPKTSELGEQEIGSPFAQRISSSRRSVCADDWQVADATEVESSAAPPFASGAATQARSIDDPSAEQSSMDRRLQRLVSDCRRPACGTVDGTRFVQPLSVECASAPDAELEAGPPGFPAPVRRERVPECDSCGQRRTLWIQGSGRAFALECLVDGPGDSGRIHKAGPSRTEWGSRTDAPRAQGRDDAPGFGPPAGAATAHGPVGKNLQPSPSTPSFGTAGTGGALLCQASTVAECGVGVSERLGSAPGAHQWADPMAREKTVCGGSLCWVSGGTEPDRQRQMESLFCRPSDWRVAGIGSRWDASGQVRAPRVKSLGGLHPADENQRRQNPRAARWQPRRSGSLRSPPRRGCQRAAS